MFRSRLFWKLFGSYSLLTLTMASLLAYVATSWHEERIVAEAESRLRETAGLLRRQVLDQIVARDSSQLQQFLLTVASETGTRGTIVGLDGTVLADSEKSSLAEVGSMENHKNRIELVQAAQTGFGKSSRHSTTVQQELLYVALRVDVDGKAVGFVRTSHPMQLIYAQTARMRAYIWTATAFGVGMALVITYFIVARIIKPLAALTAAAQKVAKGDYNFSLYAPYKDEVGQLSAAFRNMSEELQDQMNTLHTTSERLTTVLQGMSEGVVAVDRNELIMFANAAVGRLFDISAQAAVGQSLLSVVRIHALRDAFQSALKAGDRHRVEVTGSPQDGSRTLSVVASPLPGRPIPGVILVIHDLTDMRRLESLRQEFVANVSHELKTPLTAIRGYAETLRQGAIDDSNVSVKFLASIEEQADRLNNLILDMLRLARIESGQAAFDITAVSIAKTIHTCQEGWRSLAQAREIELVIGNSEDVSVRADAEGVRQILHNLVDNAIKYTPTGGRVQVTWWQDGQSALVQVEDNGLGISKDDQERLFERFFRVDKARSREMGGTGLGLSIVKHLTQSFNGSVSVDSEINVGSRFTVVMPLA